MANSHVTEAFDSGCRLEDAFIELKMLVHSYVDTCGEEITPVLFTLEKGVERLEVALQLHQAVLHSDVLGSHSGSACTAPLGIYAENYSTLVTARVAEDVECVARLPG